MAQMIDATAAVIMIGALVYLNHMFPMTHTAD